MNHVHIIRLKCSFRSKRDFPCGSASKESTSNAGDLGSTPGLGKSPGEGNGYPLQYSGLENSMDCIVHGVAKSWTRLSDFHFTSCLFFSQLFVRSPRQPFTFLYFFFLGMVLITASCTMSRNSIHSFSKTQSDLICWIYLSLPLYNHKGYDLGQTWMF